MSSCSQDIPDQQPFSLPPAASWIDGKQKAEDRPVLENMISWSDQRGLSEYGERDTALEGTGEQMREAKEALWLTSRRRRATPRKKGCYGEGQECIPIEDANTHSLRRLRGRCKRDVRGV
jgi:hypothetical protein